MTWAEWPVDECRHHVLADPSIVNDHMVYECARCAKEFIAEPRLMIVDDPPWEPRAPTWHDRVWGWLTRAWA